MDAWAPSLFFATAAVAGGFAAQSARRLDREFLSAMLFAGYALVYGLIPLLSHWADPTDVGLAALVALLGLAGLLVGRYFGRWRFGAPQPIDFSFLQLRGGYGKFFVAAGVVIAITGAVLVGRGQAGSLSAYLQSGRFQFRGAEASLVSVILGDSMIRAIAVPAVVLMVSPRRTVHLLGIAAAMGGAFSLFVFTKGARSAAIGLVGIALVISAYRRSRVEGRARGLLPSRNLAIFAAVGLLATVALVITHEARKTISYRGVTESFNRAITDPVDSGSLLDEEPLNYAQFLVAGVRLYPEHEDYMWLYPLRRLAFFPLQSGGLKPDDPNRLFSTAVLGSTTSTVPPTLPGEGYVTLGGLIGVAPWAAVYGLALAFVESRQRRPLAVFVISVTGIEQVLLGLRGQFYDSAIRVLAITMMGLVLLAVIRAVDAVPRARPPLPIRGGATRPGAGVGLRRP